MLKKLLCDGAGALMALMVVTAPASAEIKKTSYPRVRIEASRPYTPDAAFNKMRKAFGEAVAQRDLNALLALVAPGFVWTLDGSLANEFDPGRDAEHNFRVVFGFRGLAKTTDGGVENGPFWDTLSSYANDGTYSIVSDAGNLVCSPVIVSVADADVFEEAKEKIDSEDESIDWFYVLKETAVAKSPTDNGVPVGKISQEAFPVLNTFPSPENGATPAKPTHLEVLLSSGRTGWIPVASIKPLQQDRLCYAMTAQGDWKIAIFDASPE